MKKDASYFMGPIVVNQPIPEEEYFWPTYFYHAQQRDRGGFAVC